MLYRLFAITFLLICGSSFLAVDVYGQNASGRSYLGDSRATYRMFIMGDKLAGGLWAGAARVSKGNRRLSLEGRFREGSGLIRRQTYNWPRAAEKIRSTNRFEIAILMLGSNDARNLSQGEGSHAFGSNAWQQVYRSRLREMIAPFKEENIAVYLVGLPVMRSPEYDAAVKFITDIQQSVARELGVRFIDTRTIFSTPDGKYTERGTDIDGQTTRLRSRNGVHFIVAGNNKLAAVVLDVIRKDIEIADGVRAPEPIAGAGETIEIPTAGELPVFGFSDITGETRTIAQADLPDPTAILSILQSRLSASARKTTARQLLGRLRAVSPKNSAAEKLFTTGIWSDPPEQRIDDFSWTDRDIQLLR